MTRGVASQRFYRELEPTTSPKWYTWLASPEYLMGIKATNFEPELIMYSCLKSGRRQAPLDSGISPNDPPAQLRDSDQPFVYDIRFSKKSFTLELYDTSSPNQHWTSLKPDVVVLAFDISNRETLVGLKEVFPHHTHCPVRSIC